MALREKIMNFCILNSSELQKEIQKYEEAKSERSRTWVRFMALHRGQSFPQHHASLPRDMSREWLEIALQHAKDNGERVPSESLTLQ